ncbi:MAG: DUF2911 domain-containing protein [Rhizobacter sp.]|nr:DUF2911 domain-containing protein [Ferruginibacter sp.]
MPYIKNYPFILLVMFVGVLYLPSCKTNSSDAQSVSVKDTLKALPGNQHQNIDQSPMDISYCPAEYPQNKMKELTSKAPVARVIYSRPHKKGRVIFSDDPKSLCQYGKPWRLGANEATEIEFFQPVMIRGKNIDAGRYVLYCIPHLDKWEVIFNSNLNSWGLQIDPTKDVFKTELPVQRSATSLEDFTILFQDSPDGADLLIAWDSVKVLMPVTFSK